jgi:hypothetical protein
MTYAEDRSLKSADACCYVKQTYYLATRYCKVSMRTIIPDKITSMMVIIFHREAADSGIKRSLSSIEITSDPKRNIDYSLFPSSSGSSYMSLILLRIPKELKERSTMTNDAGILERMRI